MIDADKNDPKNDLNIYDHISKRGYDVELKKDPRYRDSIEQIESRLTNIEQSLLRGMADQRKRIDTLEDMVKNLNKRLSNISSQHLTGLREEDL